MTAGPGEKLNTRSVAVKAAIEVLARLFKFNAGDSPPAS
jgi:hypothetical protein